MLYTFYEDLYDYGLADLQNKKMQAEREIEKIKTRIDKTDASIRHAGPFGIL